MNKIIVSGGSSKSNFEIVDRKIISEGISGVFMKYRDVIIKDLRNNLHKSDKDQPGKLAQSIDVKIKTDSSNVSFILYMEDYWKFIDEGVQGTEGNGITSQYKFKKAGKRIPLDSIKKFIAVRGISPAMNIKLHQKEKQIKGKGKLSKKIKKTVKKINKQNDLNSAAFAIGSAIKKHGIKPTYFMSNVINEDLYIIMKQEIEEKLGKSIEMNFLI